MKKIALYHEIPDERYWKDGLWAAIEILKRDYEIVPFADEADVLLIETGSYGKQLQKISGKKFGKKIWFHAGGPPRNLPFDHTVVLAPEIQRAFAAYDIATHVINGTNTDIFKPMKLEKSYDVIFPAAFAMWKRHHMLIKWVREAAIKPERVLVVGHKQKVETECYEICEKEGFVVLDRVLPESLALLYNQSKACWIPSETMGGSEKTLLEARACEIPVRVADDNLRLQELLEAPLFGHHVYAEKIKNLIES